MKYFEGTHNTGTALRLWAYGLISLVVATLSGPMTGVSSRAWAQDVGQSGLRVEEIIVTARRKEENIQSVPVAITALTAEVIRSALKFEDLQAMTPSLGITTTLRGANTSAYAIRGHRGSVSYTSLVDPAVSVYFAEFNQSRSNGTNQTMYDIQSVQVLKGPQGTLFGRNSTGGAIVIEPQAPTDVFEGYVQGSAGNYSFTDIEAMVNVPFSDKVQFRVAGKVTDRDGYLHDVVSGRDDEDLHMKSVRVSLAIEPSDTVKSTFIGSFFTQRGTGSANKTFVFDPRGLPALGPLATVLANGFTSMIAQQRTLDNFDYLGPAIPGKLYSVYEAIQNRTTVDLGSSSALGDITLKNVIGYKTVKDKYTYNLLGGFVDVFSFQDGHLKNSSWSDEIQLQGKTGNLDYVVGAMYFQEHGDDYYGSRALTFLRSVSPAFPSRNHGFFDFRSESYAVFAHANYEISDGLSVSGGARWTKDNRYANLHNLVPSGTGFLCTSTATLQAQNNPSICNFPERISYSQPTYDVSVNYRANPDLLLYVAHRHGYRAGGFNANLPVANTTANASFAPEKVNDIEVGEKLDFSVGGMGGRLNTAGYYQWFNSIQRTITAPNPFVPGSVISIIANAAKAHIYGGEVELTLKPTEAFTITATYAYIKAAYDQFIDRRLIGGVLTPIDISDSPFALIPKHQYGLMARYTLPLPEDDGEASLQLTYAGHSKVALVDGETSNCGPGNVYLACLGSLGDVKGFGFLNFRADWNNVAGKRFDLSVIVNNVTNKYYFDGGQNGLSSFGIASGHVGAPRMFVVQLRVPFGGEKETKAAAAAPAAPPPPAPAPKAAAPAPAVPAKVLAFFDFDKSNLRADAKEIVKSAADQAKAGNKTVIRVTGHADTSGSTDYNLGLSQRRAMTVKAELIRLGIPEREISVAWKGESEPLVATADGVKEPQNRRVEIIYE